MVVGAAQGPRARGPHKATSGDAQDGRRRAWCPRPRLRCRPGPARAAVTSGAHGDAVRAAALLRLPRDQTPTPSVEPFLLQGPQGPGAECFLLLRRVSPVVD